MRMETRRVGRVRGGEEETPRCETGTKRIAHGNAMNFL